MLGKTTIVVLLITNLFIYTNIEASTQEINNPRPDFMTTAKEGPLRPGVILTNDCRDGAYLIDKMVAGSLSLNNYSAHFQMLVYKDNKIIKEAGIIHFRKPQLLRVDVNQGPNKGALAILGSDGKIHGHLGGLLKYFPSWISVDSDVARAINGFPLAGTDFYSLAQDLKNMLKQGDGSLSSQTPITTGKTAIATYILDMYAPAGKSNNSPALLLKRIYVNPETYLPVFWEDYREGKLWSESLWHDLQTNLALPDSLFKT